jgi:hypothetical protein
MLSNAHAELDCRWPVLRGGGEAMDGCNVSVRVRMNERCVFALAASRPCGKRSSLQATRSTHNNAPPDKALLWLS